MARTQIEINVLLHDVDEQYDRPFVIKVSDEESFER